jgi:molecular chaperone GrpE
VIDRENTEPEGAAEEAAPEAPAEAEATAVEHDLDELLGKARERDEYLSLAQRTQADFENYRKRAAKEQAAAEARGIAKLAREVLPALDNLGRALEAGAGGEELVAGIRLVEADLQAALERLGIEAYTPQGERFDPNFHEAMARQPVEGAESGTVVEVYQPGYRMNGLVLRPARVVVAE